MFIQDISIAFHLGENPASESFGVFSGIKLKLDKGSLALPSVGDLLKGFPIEHYMIYENW